MIVNKNTYIKLNSVLCETKMSCTAENLKYLQELVSSCFLPALKEDLDNVPLNSEHFGSYRQALEIQLPVLYDLLQQNRHWIFSREVQESYELFANVIILLSEINAVPTVYRLSNENIQRNAHNILQEHAPINIADVEQIVFEYYQNKLIKDVWKKQLGSLHGFVRYLEYSSGTLPKRWVNFCLSVGLTVRESHEPTCKRIGIVIFALILKSGNFTYIQEQNIHSVIYDSAVKDLDFIDSVEEATDIWECLHKCLNFHKELSSFNWCQLDDLMEKAIKNVTMAPNNDISLCNLQQVAKMGAYFAINQQEIVSCCEAGINGSSLLEQCRNVCASNNSYTNFRWAKSILTMFNVESYKLMQNKEMSQKFLLAMHKCYLVCILPIELQIISPHLIAFLEKFTSVLMEVIITQKMDLEIIQIVSSILETFKHQLQHSPYTHESEDFTKFNNALAKLLHHNIFVQIK
ncbi:uncharacterized protein LOC105216768 isoform X2 [Zeugodacus cucurbitae]|uniref:uncharacterized protein LOC105216768 isoform X2 n=1 Tax=Zeugodacus cucurbitae TaxID=28588 RepID=UPI0023D9351C|nr:uncharacterized protein LOC105216768 isoform X2 [Zeugodacus cucurbitae]